MASSKQAGRSWAKLRERSSRWQAQREALLQAAQRAIHRIGPHASMDEIAAEAGITKPILYRHFGDRRGLAVALRDQAFGFVLGMEKDSGPEAKRQARERMAALYPVVGDADGLRRLLVGFATGFQMFVEFNRNLYRFFRAEGVLDRMWEEHGEPGTDEPVAESLARSLEALFGERGVDASTARIWAYGIRGMLASIVDWSSESRAADRFELERQFDVLSRAILAGLDATLPARAPRDAGGAVRRKARRGSEKTGVARRRPRTS